MTTISSNWQITLEVDDEICGDIYMEGATRAIETVFGHGPDTADSVNIIIPDPMQEPNLGFIVQVYKAEDEADEEKHKYVRSLIPARDAGIGWLVKQLEEFEAQLKLKSGTDI